MNDFRALGLSESISLGLAQLGAAEPTSVQEASIPLLLDGKDMIMQSETGTGKTFAFLAPAIQLAQEFPETGVLVVAPTQELAAQLDKEAHKLLEASGIGRQSALMLGGTPLHRQEAKLKERPIVVVGTPGRVADLIGQGILHVGSLSYAVMDEADRLFSPELREATEAILSALPEAAGRVLSSATVHERTRKAAEPFLRTPVLVELSESLVLSESIEHWCFYCDGRKKVEFLRSFDAAEKPERCLVFISDTGKVEAIAEKLVHHGLSAAGIHRRLEKHARQNAVEDFKAGKVRYLVTSDLGARGLDVKGISHVVNLDLSEEADAYVHRAGRTGRAGDHGVCVVAADAVELKRASRIAVKKGFNFICKLLEGGKVWDVDPEEFFARAEAEETEKSLVERERRKAEREQARRGSRVPRDGEDGRPIPDPMARPASPEDPRGRRRGAQGSPAGRWSEVRPRRQDGARQDGARREYEPRKNQRQDGGRNDRQTRATPLGPGSPMPPKEADKPAAGRRGRQGPGGEGQQGSPRPRARRGNRQRGDKTDRAPEA